MYNNFFSKFGRPLVLDDLCKDTAPRHPRFWRRRFLKVFTIYRHGGQLGQQTATILAIFCSQPKEAPYEIWAKLAQWLQRRNRLKTLTDRRTDGRTDGRRTKSDHKAHPEHSLGELTKHILSTSLELKCLQLCKLFVVSKRVINLKQSLMKMNINSLTITRFRSVYSTLVHKATNNTSISFLKKLAGCLVSTIACTL